MTKKIVTVCGDICPDALGPTLTHEHLSMQFECCYVPPKLKLEPLFKNLSWDLASRNLINQYPYSFSDNLVFNDARTEAAVIDSVKKFKEFGGGTLIENSTHGLRRKSGFLKKVAQETGVNVVAGTGYYVVASQDSATVGLSTEKLAEHMKSELTEGTLEDPTVKCGLIGEIGITFPMHDFERRVIAASADVQNSVGCAVSFHPGRSAESPFEILRLFQEAGGNADKTIMSHLDRTLQDKPTLMEFAGDFGCYCQFDLFGIENSYYQLAEEIDFPSDAQRMDRIASLGENGFLNRILISQDIHTKHRLEMFGGHGFKHILDSVVPKMISTKGLSSEQMDQILVANPAEALAIQE